MSNTISVNVVADVKNINKGIADVNDKLGGFGKSIGKAGSALKGMFVAGAALAVGGQVVSFFKDSVTAASDFSESTSKVGVVFGKSANQIIKASKTSATAMGLSTNEYLASTGALGNLLVSLGNTPKKAADMSQSMVKLAGDLASFNNVKPEEALAALQSGLTGETEPLKKFGINMNDATLKAQALKMGLIKSTKEALTPQNKALAAQALIMAQTGTAQGDFARTSGGLANQQRILAAQIADTKTKVGNLLLPIITKFVTFLNANAIPAIKAFGEWFTTNVIPVLKTVGGVIKDNLMPIVASISDALKVFFSFLGGNDTGVDGPFREMAVAGESARGMVTTLVDTFRNNFLPAMQTIGTFITGQVIPAFKQIVPVVMQLVGTIIANVIPVINNLATFFMNTLLPAFLSVYSYIMANVVPIFVQIYTVIATKVVPIIGDLAKWFTETLVPAVAKIVGVIATNLKPVLDSIFKVIKENVIPVVIQIADKFKEWLPTIKKVIEVVVVIIGKVLEFAAAILGKVLPPVIQFAGWLLSNLVPAVSTVIGIVVNVIKAVIDFGIGVYNAGVKVVSFVTTAVNAIGDFKDKIVAKFAAAGSWLLNIGGRIIEGLIDGIRNAMGALGKFLGGIGDFIKSHKGPPSKDAVMLFNAGKLIIGGLIDGMDSKENALKNKLGDFSSIISGTSFSSPELSLATSGLGGRNGGSTPTTIEINFNGLVTDPVMAGKEVDKVLSKYYGAGGRKSI